MSHLASLAFGSRKSCAQLYFTLKFRGAKLQREPKASEAKCEIQFLRAKTVFSEAKCDISAFYHVFI
ncbi:MAG: hypothetical protein DRR00_32650 [Candidatus Parabeggiatoa sp. nov. 3]|nr:MAG: hypothetical protein DRR00_32650 [Gammaproteobacteria bacterium]